MTYFRYAFVLTALFALLACSDDVDVITEGSATGIYNDIKGTYEGVVPVGNESRPVTIVVANDEFTIKRLPLEPILKAVFTEQKELEEAVDSSGETTTFTAPIVQMAVTSNTVALSMDPTDIVFTVTVGGERKQVSALMESVCMLNSVWGDLSVAMNAKELYCDGRSYSLTDNRVTYLIDGAKKAAQ